MQHSFEWKLPHSVRHKVLNDLAGSARAHFEYEESILLERAIALLEDQVKNHNVGMIKMANLLQDSLTGEVHKVALTDYLRELWSHHVLTSDRKYRSAFVAFGLTHWLGSRRIGLSFGTK